MAGGLKEKQETKCWRGEMRKGREGREGEKEWRVENAPPGGYQQPPRTPHPLDAGVKGRLRDGDTHPLGHHNEELCRVINQELMRNVFSLAA